MRKFLIPLFQLFVTNLLLLLATSSAHAAPQVPDPHAPVITTKVFQDYSNTQSGGLHIAADSACGPIDLAFVIDTTGSMGGALDNVDAELAGLLSAVDTASGGDYRLGLVTFKDNVSVNSNLASGNRAQIQSQILSLFPDGGNNTPEASDQAVKQVVSGFNFRPSALKIVVLVTDAPPGGFDDQFTPGVDDAAARLVAQQAAAKNIKISAIYVPTDGLDSTTSSIMQSYARLSSGFYTQTASDGTGTADGIQQVIANCGGNLVFTQPVDGQEFNEFPTLVKGKATPNSGETYTRVDFALQRASDGFYWNGSKWVKSLTHLPTTLNGVDWSGPSGSGALPTKDDVTNGKYKFIAFAYDAKGRVKTASVSIDITPEIRSSITTSHATKRSGKKRWPMA